MLKKIAVCSICVAAFAFTVRAQVQETVNLDSGSQTVFDQGNTALTGGTASDGNGAVLQLGYFTTSTPSFSGTFVPLTGEGSLNTETIPGSSPSEGFNKTSI